MVILSTEDSASIGGKFADNRYLVSVIIDDSNVQGGGAGRSQASTSMRQGSEIQAKIDISY